MQEVYFVTCLSWAYCSKIDGASSIKGDRNLRRDVSIVLADSITCFYYQREQFYYLPNEP